MNIRRAVRLFLLCVMSILSMVLVFAQSSQKENTNAKALIQQSLALLGGEAAWRGITTSRLEGLGHQYWLEVPERPEGPWPTQYFQFSELRKLDQKAFRRSYSQRWKQVPNWSPDLKIIYSGGLGVYEIGPRKVPAPAAQVETFDEWMKIAPERVLLDALDAGNLVMLPGENILGAPHHAIQYIRDVSIVRLYINENTLAFDALELEEDHQGSPFWNVWGDVTTRVVYQYWTQEEGKVVFPRQWHVEKNGLPYQDWTITKVLWNVDIPADSIAINDSLRMMAGMSDATPDDVPLTWRAKQPITEIMPGVVKIFSGFDVALVKQNDGIVVIEAPTSNGFSQKVIEEADRRFPGIPIKALISTDHYVAHNAGVREYAAHGIPIYALKVNEPFLNELLSAPHKIRPDSLARSMRKPVLRPISARFTLGTGETAMELIPMNTMSGERMMMIYFPSLKLLYGSDLFQQSPSGEFYTKQTLTEFVHLVRKAKLEVQKVFMTHIGLMEWGELEKATH